MGEQGRLTNRRFRMFLAEFKSLMEAYSEQAAGTETEFDWVRYEREYAERIRYLARELNGLVESASRLLVIESSRLGRPRKLGLQERVISLLVKTIFQQSNRRMSGLLSLFHSFGGVDVSYKTIERAYSDELVRITIHNMLILTMNRKGLKEVDVTGDGTGYSLTISKHYRTDGGKQGERGFIYSFNMMDIRTGLYVCYGSGLRSERQAFTKAMSMLEKIKARTGLKIKSARLDKQYSFQSTLNFFDEETVLYILPRSNTTINGPPRWQRILRRMMSDPISYIREYHKRQLSESGFSADKRTLGWRVWQKRDDRIDTAVGCLATLHNLLRMSYH
ncbi:MAG: ISNCY family transposase [Candidatus Bathyarchaeia archaeon]